MTESDLKKQTASSLIWKLFERFGSQIIQFVVSIVLARLLCPEDYGAIALLTIFIAVANTFIQTGFSSALIRKQDADDLDYSSVFYCSLAIALLFYIILFFTAPAISEFYKMPVLKNVLRVMSLTLIIGTYNGIQNVILAKNLLFKKLFISSFGAIILSGVIGVLMAYMGYGIWALVAQQLTLVTVTTIIMMFTVKWRPKLLFSFKRLKVLFKFGWKLLMSGLLDVLYNNIYSLIIGKRYSSADLGQWNRGKQFPELIVSNVNGSISSVMYPVYSKMQDDKIALKAVVRRSIKISSYIVFPLMMGLAVCAEPIVRLLLGEQWLPCVIFLQGWCFCSALMPVHIANLQIYNALGRSDVFLYLEIVKKVIGIATLIITLPFGLNWMMFGMMSTSVLGGFINAFPNLFIIKYKLREQIMDLLPSILITCMMGAMVYFIKYIPMHYVGVLAIQIVVGILIYFGLSLLFGLESCKYVLNMLKKLINKMKKHKKVS